MKISIKNSVIGIYCGVTKKLVRRRKTSWRRKDRAGGESRLARPKLHNQRIVNQFISNSAFKKENLHFDSFFLFPVGYIFP